MSQTREWIETDETAMEMLTRVFAERPFLPLPPPLHKLPLRPGNVVEIVGPPSSAKTHVLMQVGFLLYKCCYNFVLCIYIFG